MKTGLVGIEVVHHLGIAPPVQRCIGQAGKLDSCCAQVRCRPARPQRRGKLSYQAVPAWSQADPLADVKPAAWTVATLSLGVRDAWPATLLVAGLFSPIWLTYQHLTPADTKPVGPL